MTSSAVPFLRSSLLVGCLLAGLGATLPAQVPTALPAAPALPGEPSALPTTPINGTNPPVSVPVERPEVRFEFNASPVADVLHYYEGLTGKTVLVDPSVQGQITVNVNNVTRTQATHIIEAALNLAGFALLDSPDNVVKVLGLGRPVKPQGVPIFSELAAVPDTEQIVTLLVRLNFLEPQEAAGLLSQYITPQSTSIGFAPLQKAGALLLTDTGRSVRRLATLLQLIDISPLSVEDRFFRLERADATKAVEFLNSVFETKSSGGSTGGNTGGAVIPGTANPAINAVNRRPIRRVGEDGVPVDVINAGGTNANPNGDTLIVGRITLTPDVRTNRVHVVTNHRNMEEVARLLAEYDTDTRFATPVRRDLRFVNARDVLPILVQTLAEPGSDNANGSGTTPAPGATNTSRNGGGNSNNLFNNLNNNSSSSSSNGYGSSGGSSNIGSEGLDTQTVDTTPTEAVVGNTKLIADPRANTIIILGGTDARDKVFKVLDELDKRAPQVVIRTLIGELSLTDAREFGLNYLLRDKSITALSQFNSGQLTGATPSSTASPSPSGSTSSALNTFTTLATGLGTSFTGVGGILAVTNSFDIILSALESTNRFKTISNPMIFTQNNKKAIIASGQEIAVPSSQVGTTTGSATGTGVYTNVEYKNVTLQLEVVPLINSNREVTLDILQKIDSVVAGSSTTVNGTQIPTIATRYLKSNVSAPNDSTIVLGGLITQNENKTDGAIPYLNRIPILGKLLFTTRTRGNDRSELVILMHPQVINGPAELANLREREEDRTYLGQNLEGQLQPMVVKRAIPVVTPAPAPARTRKATVTTTTTVK